MNSIKGIKINVLSQSRFHMLDLSRELAKQGFDVKFYSYVPQNRCIKFGLDKQNCCSLFIYLFPFLCIEKILKIDIVKRIQDFLLYIFMRKCDILISLTGFIKAPSKAKRMGSIIIFERGSKHIIEQKKILESNYNRQLKHIIPNRNVRLNLEAYKLADYISVASQHVVDSFLLHNYPSGKLFKNPYGVDLKMFSPQPNTKKKYDFIMVGGWCYRKGCDLIIDAIKNTQYTLLHVGSITDLEFPKDKLFTHIEPVDQSKLSEYYAQAKIFVMPSREDGFGMVLSQALACNLPLIGSKDSGAIDLKGMVEDPQYITILKEYTVEALIKAMKEAMDSYPSLGNKIYAGTAIENLTWEAYGKRYAQFLHQITKK